MGLDIWNSMGDVCAFVDVRHKVKLVNIRNSFDHHAEIIVSASRRHTLCVVFSTVTILAKSV